MYTEKKEKRSLISFRLSYPPSIHPSVFALLQSFSPAQEVDPKLAPPPNHETSNTLDMLSKT